MFDDLRLLLGGQAWPALRPVKPVRTYAQDMGWKTTSTGFGEWRHDGFYHAAGQRWRGAVRQDGLKLDFWIERPPIGVIRGTKWEGCFHAIGRDGWWRISFVPGLEPSDLDAGLVAINKILQVCFRQAAGRRW